MDTEPNLSRTIDVSETKKTVFFFFFFDPPCYSCIQALHNPAVVNSRARFITFTISEMKILVAMIRRKSKKKKKRKKKCAFRTNCLGIYYSNIVINCVFKSKIWNTQVYVARPGHLKSC